MCVCVCVCERACVCVRVCVCIDTLMYFLSGSCGERFCVDYQVAKWTGDFFNKGIYDIHIQLRGVPLLEWETEVEMDK